MEIQQLTTMVSALWLTAAILAGGFARTRNRSAWVWFVLTAFLGPIAAFLLVTWPPAAPPRGPDSTRDPLAAAESAPG